VEQAKRAAPSDARGASTIAILGNLLELATHKNYQAPQVGKYIVAGDPAVQALLEELATSTERLARDGAAEAAEMALYRTVLKQIGEGHSVLQSNAAHLTRAEAVYFIRNAEDRLRRAEAALPRSAPVQTAAAVSGTLPE
jgi:hypothetical protein